MRTKTLQEKYWLEVSCIVDYSHRVHFSQVFGVLFIVVGFLLPLLAELSGEHYTSGLFFSCISWFVAFRIFWDRRLTKRKMRSQVDSLIRTIRAELDLGYSVEILYVVRHPSLLISALTRADMLGSFVSQLKAEQDVRGISDEDILTASKS